MKSSSRLSTIATMAFGVVVFFLAVCGGVTIESIAAMIAWGWFVSPVFEMPRLEFHEAVGLVCLVNFALLPISFPVNSMRVTFERYVRHRSSIDIVNAVRALSDLRKEIGEEQK